MLTPLIVTRHNELTSDFSVRLLFRNDLDPQRSLRLCLPVADVNKVKGVCEAPSNS